MSETLKKIVVDSRLPVMFVGAGLSKRYLLNYPSWEELIEKCFNVVDPTGILYRKEVNYCRRENLSLFDTNIYLGSRAEEYYNEYYYERLKNGDIKRVPNWIHQDVSPLKMYIRSQFKRKTKKNASYLVKELSLLRSLGDKISSVITTNYDEFLETEVFTENFDVFYKQQDLFKSERTNIAEIYKIHGTVNNANSMIFTKNDYKNYEKSQRLVIAKMLTLFSDSPIIFLGYSMSDENVINIIMDFLECLDDVDNKEIQNHFVFVEYKKGERNLVETKENIVTSRGVIPITKISTDNFTEIFKILNTLSPGLPANIVKNARRLIHRIVESSTKTGKKDAVVINFDEIDTLDDKDIAIAFGQKDSILGTFGYGTIPISNLFKDVLTNEYNYLASGIVSKRLVSEPRTVLLPIYKYYSNLNEGEKESNTYVEKFLVRDSFENIYGAKNISSIRRIRSFDNLGDFREFIRNENLTKVDQIFKFFSASIENLSASDIRIFCIEYLKDVEDEGFSSTFFKRAVMYLDVLEHKKT